METIKTISQYIQDQFPQVYKEDGPQLIAFVEAYFEFLETQKGYSIEEGRKLLETNDIDTTLDEFIVHYKEKYLADFPFVSSTDKRFMIKHIMDYYRTKGSPKSLELLMKMLYGEEIEIYYPGNDILRVSDSDWFKPIYLEVSRSPRTKSFLNKQIRGSRGVPEPIDVDYTEYFSGDGTSVFEFSRRLQNEAKKVEVYIDDVKQKIVTDYNLSVDKIIFQSSPPVGDDNIRVTATFEETITRKPPTAFVESIVTKRVDGKLIDLLFLSDVKGTFRKNDYVTDDGNIQDAPKVVGSLSDVDIELGGRNNKVGDVFDVDVNGARQGKVRVTDVQDATGRVDFELINGGSGYDKLTTDVYVSDVVLDVKNSDLDFIRFERIEQPIEKVNLLSSSDLSENLNQYDYIAAYSANSDYVANGIILESSNTYSNGDIIESGVQALGMSSNVDIFTVGETVNSNNASGSISSLSGVEMIVNVSDGTFLNGDVVVGSTSGANSTVVSSSPGVELKVLVTDQSFANQILVTLDSNTASTYSDGEIVAEENEVLLSLQNETGEFTIGNKIVQFKEANANFTVVETFQGDGTTTTFTHTSDLANSEGVSVVVDGNLQEENLDYTISGSDVIFEANSVPQTPSDSSNNVLIAATNTIQKKIGSAIGTIVNEGVLVVADTTGFTAGDTLTHSTTGATANLVSVDSGSGLLEFDSANGYFLSNQTVTNGSSNTNINATRVVLRPSWGEFESEIQVNSGTETASVPTGGFSIREQGARGIVQRDNTLNDDQIIILDLFGEFNSSKKIRGDKSRHITTIANFSPTGASRVYLNGNSSSNGNVDVVSNNYVTGTLVGQNTSSIGITYDTDSKGKFEADSSGNLFINTQRDLLISPPRFVISDMTFNIDVKRTHDFGEEIPNYSLTERGNLALFECFIQLPKPLEDGVLFEMGGAGTGTYLGIRDNNSVPGEKVLRLRSGDGSISGNTAITQDDLAVIDVTESNLPNDLNYHHLVWEMNPNNGNIKLWIDGVLKGDETANNSVLRGSTWAGTSPGGYGIASGSVAVDEPSVGWKGKVFSQLRYFYNASANTNSVAGSIIQLNGEKVYEASLGADATFKIEKLENEETFTLNTDFPSQNNVANIQYLDVLVSGENSGVGFVDSFTIHDGGEGYTVNSPISITNGGFAGGDPLVNAEAQISSVNANGTITAITVTTQGEGYFESPDFQLPTSNTITDANVSINMDYGYGFPKNPDADRGNLIIDALTFDDFTIGSIVTLGSINPGAGYNRDPFVVVYNKYIASYQRGNYEMYLSNVSGFFEEGEILIQVAGNEEFTKGKVTAFDPVTDIVTVERISFEEGFDFQIPIQGSTSGASGTIDKVISIEGQNVMGDNAVVDADVIAANGIATSVEVIDSGYGYFTGGEATLSNENTPFIITGTSKAEMQGTGEGYWRNTNSHLNSEKKIQDNKYYQEFSYEVLSGLSLRRYENILKRVFHVAGTEMFGSVVRKTDIDTKAVIEESSISQE